MLIALIGYGQAEDRRRSAEAGFDFHLVRPVYLDQLKELLAGSTETLLVGSIEGTVG